MKTKLFLILAILVLLVPLAMPMTARADGSRIDFTGMETSCPDEPFELTREWMAGPNYHAHIKFSTCIDDGSIPQVTGTNNLSDGVLNYVGGGLFPTVSGKWRLVTVEGGSWEGSFVLAADDLILKAVGKGEGIYAGQRIYMFCDQDTSLFWGYIETGE